VAQHGLAAYALYTKIHRLTVNKVLRVTSQLLHTQRTKISSSCFSSACGCVCSISGPWPCAATLTATKRNRLVKKVKVHTSKIYCPVSANRTVHTVGSLCTASAQYLSAPRDLQS
jgi:hypothetical protein